MSFPAVSAAVFLITSATVGLIPTHLAAQPAKAATAVEDTAIRPFRVNIPEEELVDLRRRIAATRWPDRETVDDQSQGILLAKLKPLVEYWGTGYDRRTAEAKLNELPQFMTNVDALDIYFIHVRSPHPQALPLIMTHGWPGSVFELLKTVGPLTNRRLKGGVRRTRSISFCLRCLDMASPAGLRILAGSRPHRASLGGADAALRLHPLHRPKRDWGSPVANAMARPMGRSTLTGFWPSPS